MKIVLDNFVLEQINITKQEHLNLIKKFDRDDLVKKYLYPYKESFYDLVTESTRGDNIFYNFYVIYKDNKPIGYIEIEAPNKTFLNCALLNSERNKGYASMITRELSNYFLSNYAEVNSVNAIIRKNNLYSINAIENAGFNSIKEDADFITYNKTR